MNHLRNLLPFNLVKSGFLKSRGFTMVPNIIIENENFSIYEKMVFIIIKKHQMNKRKSWPSLSKIASQSGCSVSSVKKAIGHLQELGILKKERPDMRKCNTYRIVVDKLKNIC